MSIIVLYSNNSGAILHITLQVTDVLAVAIKELRSNSSNRQNVVEWGVGAL